MVKVIWSKRASGQLERNVKYIKEEQGVSYAATVLNKILSSTALLGKLQKWVELNHSLTIRKPNTDSSLCGAIR